MTYPDVIKNLDARGFFHIKPGLARMQRVAKALQHPERQWAALHIAGTNGKGSVSATLESVLRHASYKTGLYTSPHLVSLSERIRVNGRPISNAAFTACGNRLFRVEKKLNLRLTYFEFVTALAYLHFSDEKIDVGVIECGMGGRWDATNIIPRPMVSVITSVGLDHTAWLGTTLQAIAKEKAGIIKWGGRTVSGVQGNVASIIKSKARQRDNAFFALNHEFQGVSLHVNWQKPLQSWSYQAGNRQREPIETPLMGLHQVDNGAISMKVIESLRESGWTIGEKAIDSGFKAVQWPGRMQLFHRPQHPKVLLDGAHNPHAMLKLLQTLKDPPFSGSGIAFIFSAFSDKDVANMARQIGPLAERIYLCEMSGQRRAPLADLAKAFAAFRAKIVLCPGGIEDAISRAWSETRAADSIVATGSLMLVGEILKKKTVQCVALSL